METKLSRWSEWFAVAARILVGILFIIVGWMKVSDMATTVMYFGESGLAPFWAYVVGWSEFLGGILLVLGLWTWLPLIVLSITMIAAAYLSRSMGFAGMMGPLYALASLLGILALGQTKWSLRFGRRDSMSQM